MIDIFNPSSVEEVLEANTKEYFITLSDGTKIDNLSMKGLTFVSKTELKSSTFFGKTSTVTIHNKTDNEETTYYNLRLSNAGVRYVEDEKPGYRFSFMKIPEEDLKFESINSSLDYLAMMVDVSL